MLSHASRLAHRYQHGRAAARFSRVDRGSVPAVGGHAPATPAPRAGGTVVARGDAGGGPVSLPRREEIAVTHTHPAGHHGGPPRPERDRVAPPPLLAAALRAAATGWAVFPVRPRGKTPAVTDWENAATTDPDRIAAWWRTEAWNVGLAAGRSGLIVLDLDVPTPADPTPSDTRTAAVPARFGGDDGAGGGVPGAVDRARQEVSGVEVLRRLAADAGAASPWHTLAVATPSGGRHLYFRQPDGAGLRNTQGALGLRIDTRGHGGYVLAAGSRGPDSQQYRILRDVPVAPLPVWLHDVLTTAPALSPGADGAARPGRDHPTGDDSSTDLHLPVVSAARVEAYLRAVVDGESRAVTAASVGSRHTTLLRAARRLGQWVGSGALTPADARAVLTAAARSYVGVAGFTARQVERDIADGLAYGAARPRHIDDLPDWPAHRASDAHR